MADSTSQSTHPTGGEPGGSGDDAASKRRVWIALGVAAVVVIGLGIFFWPAKRGPHIDEDTLAAVLPDVAQLNAIMGATEMKVTGQAVAAGEAPTPLARPECAGVLDPNVESAYEGSGFSAIHSYIAREPGYVLGHYVSAAVVSFPGEKQAEAYVEAAQRTWESCGGELWTQSEPAYAWNVGPVEGAAPNIRLQTTRDRWLPACQRALQAAANVVIDVKACTAEPGVQAQVLADEIKANVEEKTSG